MRTLSLFGLPLVFVLTVHGICSADADTLVRSDRRSSFPSAESVDRFSPSGVENAVRNVSQSVSPEDWQKRYDAAKAKKRTGTALLLGGIGAMGGGFILMNHEEDAFSDCFNALSSSRRGGTCVEDVRPGAALTLGGAGVFLWGFFVRRDGAQTVEALEPRRPSSTTLQRQPGFPIGTRSSVSVAVGRRSSVDYRIKW